MNKLSILQYVIFGTIISLGVYKIYCGEDFNSNFINILLSVICIGKCITIDMWEKSAHDILALVREINQSVEKSDK